MRPRECPPTAQLRSFGHKVFNEVVMEGSASRGIGEAFLLLFLFIFAYTPLIGLGVGWSVGKARGRLVRGLVGGFIGSGGATWWFLSGGNKAIGQLAQKEYLLYACLLVCPI